MIKFSVRHPVSITMLIGIILGLGFISYTRLKVELFPQLEFPSITIVTTYKNASPYEVEELISKPIEQVVSTANRVKKVSSMNMEGVSIVTVEFEWGTNLDFAAQELRDRIGLIEDYLPKDASKPVVYKFSMEMMPIMQGAIISDHYRLEYLTKLAEDYIKPQIERIDGVAICGIYGTKEDKFLIKINLDKLVKYGLSLNQINQMLGFNNFNLPAGYVISKRRELIIRTIGKYKSIEDLKNQVVGYTKNHTPIFLKDIAKIEKWIGDKRGFSKINNKEVVYFSVNKLSGANTVDVSNRVRKTLKELEKHYKGIKFEISFDQGEFAKLVARRTIRTAILGSILAALMIFIFLLNFRPTIVISIVIPLSIIISFTVLYFSKLTFNTMTLAGIALGVGMLVDAAIVVVENIYRHMEEGHDNKKAAILGTEEVALAITASVFTNIIIFLPLIFVRGIIGRIAKPLAIAVVSTFLASLFVTLTIVPMLSSQMFKIRKIRETWFKPLRILYEKILRNFVLRFKSWIVFAGFFTFLLAGILIKFLKIEFLPQMDRRTEMLIIEMPPGTEAKETERFVDNLSRFILKNYPEVRDVFSYGGVYGEEAELALFSVAMGGGGTNTANIAIKFKDPSKRKRKSFEVVNDILSKIPNYKNIKIKKLRMEAFLTGAGMETKPIQINLYGNDLEELKKTALELKDELSKIKGVWKPEISLKEAKPELRIIIDRQKAAYYGLTPMQIQSEIETGLKGKKITQIQLNGETYDIYVRCDKKEEFIKTFPIKTPTGKYIPLSEIATFKYTLGPIRIDREKQKRLIKVLAENKGRSVGRILGDIKKLLQNKAFPLGIDVSIGGELEYIQSMLKDMTLAIIASVILVYMVMAALFESFVNPFIIIFSIPLGAIGIVTLMKITGISISVPSLLGILIFVGVAVNQGIVMISMIKEFENKGLNRFEAIVKGASTRLRPVLISGLTTIIGLLPMALSKGYGAGIRTPIAVALIGGLLSSMILTLFFIPAFYALIHKVRK